MADEACNDCTEVVDQQHEEPQETRADPLLELALASIDGDDEAVSVEASITELLEAPLMGNDDPTHLVILDAGSGPICLRAPTLPPSIVLPGSFNPIHPGHEEMAERTAVLAGHSPETALFEICAWNPDKGGLPCDELLRRTEAITARGHRVLLTRASFFFQKAAICRGCDIAIGYDTYRRVVDAKYYVPEGATLEEATEEERREWVLKALRELAICRVRMVVAGRVDGPDFRSLETHPLIDLDGDLEGLFVPLPDFRLDISSTELRQQAAEAAAAAAADAAAASEEAGPGPADA